jgi:hypothetical protein
MSKPFICPFCGVEKPKKDQIDFHIKYGHAEVYHLMQDDVELHDLEDKLDELCNQKQLLEKEIKLMKSILEMRKEEE